MTNEKNKSFKQLAKTVREKIEFGREPTFEGEVILSLNPFATSEIDITEERLDYVRLRAEGKRDDLPTHTPTDPIDFLALCEDAAQSETEATEDISGNKADATLNPELLMTFDELEEYYEKSSRGIRRLAKKYDLEEYPDTEERNRIRIYKPDLDKIPAHDKLKARDYASKQRLSDKQAKKK